MRKRTVKRIAVVVGIVLLIALCRDDEPDHQQAIYCEMVRLHQETGGDYGWPDYRNEYGELCDE